MFICKAYTYLLSIANNNHWHYNWYHCLWYKSLQALCSLLLHFTQLSLVFFWHLTHLPCVQLSRKCFIPSYRTRGARAQDGPPIRVLSIWRDKRVLVTFLLNCRWHIYWFGLANEYHLYAATTDKFKAWVKIFHHHCLARNLGLYEDKIWSEVSTPPIPELYILIGWGCETDFLPDLLIHLSTLCNGLTS